MTYATPTNPGARTLAGIAQTDLAATLLRVSMGGLFIVHASLKIFVFTPAGTAAYFASLGLPAPLAYLVMAAELLGGIALIVGFQTRLVALALVPILLGAIFTAHATAGFIFSNAGGGWEYPAFWAVALVVQALLGGGAFALTRDRG
ncbi:MAG: DoxX family protein [Rhodobacteraceae bacterium]|jgi:putative oxidoreductase|nr:DoxX family protein [Paracoccaceae bacterium]